MPSPPVPDEVLRATVEARKLYPSQVAAARALGISRRTLQERLQKAEDKWGAVPPSDVPSPLAGIVESLRRELDDTRRALKSATKPRYTIRQDIFGETDTIRVIVMGDAHDDPTIPDKSRFEWAGKYAAEAKADVLVSIGDFLNMNSLCFHVPDENYSGKAKPTFITDILSGKQAFAALNSGLGNWNPEKHLTVGNHENRLYRQEDSAPSSMGMYQSLFDECVSGAGFTYSAYGDTHLIGGVGFTHIPLNIMGRPSSARHLNSLGNDSIRDLVFGHRHRATAQPFPKIGGTSVTLVDSGCYLPWGYKKMESFAEHTPGEWSYVLTDLRIKNRRIVDCNFVSVMTLEERYGHRT